MKKTILILSLFAIATSAIITSCQSSTAKVEAAQNDLSAAEVDLKMAQQEYDADYLKFKSESDVRIKKYEADIAALKVKIAKENKADRSNLEKAVSELEIQNKKMQAKLNDYKDEGKEKWTSFKTEFNHDMDELGKSFADLTKNNI